MIGANKILTVSYGTFSCTLEGFDEPFSTMKAIAEYFRDLAAEDRYFGAEPPTPDAEMLHRIAEREIQRRVEAKISENTVVLRQVETPVPAPAVTDMPAVAEMPAAETTAPAAVAKSAPVVADAVATTPAIDDSISDKLRRIRAVVANAQTQPIATAAAADTAFYEDLAGRDADLNTEPAEYAEPMDDDFGFALELDPQDLSDVLALNEPDALVEQATEVEPVAEPIVEEAPEAVSLVVADEASWGALEAEVSRADIFNAAEPTAAAAAIEEEISLDALREVLATDDVTGDELADADLSEAVADDDTPSSDEATGPSDAAVWEAIEEAGPAHVLAAAVTEAPARSEAEIWDEVEATTIHAAEAGQQDKDQTAEAFGMDDQEDDDDNTPMSPLAHLIARTRARVEGARRGAQPEDLAGEDFDDVASEMDSGEIAASDDAAAIVAGNAEAEPEPEEDEDLIAGIEAVIGAIDEHEAAVAAEEEAETGRSSAAGKSMLVEDAEDGDDFERLMDEANTKLEGAESRRRFSAISHLKAAVAATVADRLLKPKDAPAETLAPSEPEIDRYRDDLSRAVRPRRPEAEGERVTARPAMPMRPAPLVLVSEQRVDRENLQPAAVVRPRRIATTLIVGDEDDMSDADPLSPEDAKSFTEFAERLGARSLAELLEVAAVYTATVEGKNSFSRPHLLRRVNAATGVEDFSREDYLRSFGSLLRQGRIQKVEPGRFSVTDVSPFMTEMRRVAN